MSSDNELVAQACRVLGHVSLRLGDSETMLIKGKGPGEVGLRYTRPEDILTVDFSANKISGADDLQPPSESFLHIWLYRKRPEVRSVIHVHPEHAVLLTICDKEILPIYGAYGSGARLALDGVRTYPRSITIHDDQLGEEFADFMGASNVALMQGHGATTARSPARCNNRPLISPPRAADTRRGMPRSARHRLRCTGGAARDRPSLRSKSWKRNSASTGRLLSGIGEPPLELAA